MNPTLLYRLITHLQHYHSICYPSYVRWNIFVRMLLAFWKARFHILDLVASPMSLWLLWWPPTGSSMFMFVVMLHIYFVLHCLYSVGNKITTTTTRLNYIYPTFWKNVRLPPTHHLSLLLLWGLVYHKLLSTAGTSNYIPQDLWDVITCPRPWCLILVQHPWFNLVCCRDVIRRHNFEWTLVIQRWTLRMRLTRKHVNAFFS